MTKYSKFKTQTPYQSSQHNVEHHSQHYYTVDVLTEAQARIPKKPILCTMSCI